MAKFNGIISNDFTSAASTYMQMSWAEYWALPAEERAQIKQFINNAAAQASFDQHQIEKVIRERVTEKVLEEFNRDDLADSERFTTVIEKQGDLSEEDIALYENALDGVIASIIADNEEITQSIQEQAAAVASRGSEATGDQLQYDAMGSPDDAADAVIEEVDIYDIIEQELPEALLHAVIERAIENGDVSIIGADGQEIHDFSSPEQLGESGIPYDAALIVINGTPIPLEYVREDTMFATMLLVELDSNQTPEVLERAQEMRQQYQAEVFMERIQEVMPQLQQIASIFSGAFNSSGREEENQQAEEEIVEINNGPRGGGGMML